MPAPPATFFSEEELELWIFTLRPVQFVGSPVCPWRTEPKCATCNKALAFDSFGDSVVVIGISGYHKAVPCIYTCKTSECKRKSRSTAKEFLDCQAWDERGIHRWTEQTSWTGDAVKIMEFICQNSVVAAFRRFLEGTCMRTPNQNQILGQQL